MYDVTTNTAHNLQNNNPYDTQMMDPLGQVDGALGWGEAVASSGWVSPPAEPPVDWP